MEDLTSPIFYTKISHNKAAKVSYIGATKLSHDLIFIEARIRWGQNTGSRRCQNSDHPV